VVLLLDTAACCWRDPRRTHNVLLIVRRRSHPVKGGVP
jgi:hypothetical protein